MENRTDLGPWLHTAAFNVPYLPIIFWEYLAIHIPLCISVILLIDFKCVLLSCTVLMV
jgi:hypothetical protein